MELDFIKQDLELEQGGVWVSYAGTDFECRIARIGNPDFESKARELRQQAKIQMLIDGKTDEKTAADQLKTLLPIVADHILLDWRGLTSKGEPVPYSKEKAVELLGRRDLRDWYIWILAVANDAERFRRASTEEDLGN